MLGALPRAKPDYREPELCLLISQLSEQGLSFPAIAKLVRRMSGQVIIKDHNDRILWFFNDGRNKISRNLRVPKALVAQLGSSARLKPERPLVQFQPKAPRSKLARFAVAFGMNPERAERLYS